KSNEYYSKDGDKGTSKTLEGEVLAKDSKIFNAIGATEELLSYIGLAREYAQESEHEYSDKLKRIQTIIIDLNTAISRSKNKSLKKIIPQSHTKELEEWIREYAKELPPPEKNIIPGGGITCASLHVARAICRRTERVVVPLVKEGQLHNEALVYLNRLADFLFIVARLAAKLDKRTETIYIPKPDGKIKTQ
ncbi:cob(I)yrinic acid a,c-diamide adenosyltransferase, mitochondrial, partial [Asbolus verrucosus]